MSSNLALSVHGLGKEYRIAHENQRATTLGEAITRRIKNPLASTSYETFRALDDVSFEVEKGEVLGIIGRNGAGKSTLLKILSRITEPTHGEVRLYGRIGSLLEVGTGFHPELSGRENIFLNGAILGMRRREIERQFDAIVDFAEVEKFLDTPVKRYSSGMYVRLAFAVAAHLNPEILVVDEVLAVGDAQFQKKCLGKMQDVSRQEGRTVLFVSHNMAAVNQLCTRAIVLHKGQVKFSGSAAEAVRWYDSPGSLEIAITYGEDRFRRPDPDANLEIQFRKLAFPTSKTQNTFETGDPIQFTATLYSEAGHSHFRLGLCVFTADGTPIGSIYSHENLKIEADTETSYSIELPDTHLAPGQYFMGLSVGTGGYRGSVKDFDAVFDVLHFEVVPTTREGETYTDWNMAWGRIQFPSIDIKASPLQSGIKNMSVEAIR
jgi:lipopolysaccharide transport system ATP-binding protein